MPGRIPRATEPTIVTCLYGSFPSGSVALGVFMDDEFLKERACTVRSLAAKADPFIKKRLLDLTEKCEKKSVNRRAPPKV
jgi:hypothetical protein